MTITALLNACSFTYRVEYREKDGRSFGWGPWQLLNESPEAKEWQTTRLREDQAQALQNVWLHCVAERWEDSHSPFWYQTRIIPETP